MDQEEKKLVEELFNTTSILLADQGEISPIYFIVKDKMMNPVVAFPGISLQHLANSTVNMAHEFGADAVILICEQWMLEMHKDDEEIKEYIDGSKRPSESPDAKAYLTLTHMASDGETSSMIGEIHLSPNGIRFVRETKWIDNAVTNMITPWA